MIERLNLLRADDASAREIAFSERSLRDLPHTPAEAQVQWESWLQQARELNAEILRERNGAPVDVDSVVQAAKAELEERHDDLFGR